MSFVTIKQMAQMETSGFGESLEERIFFTGPSSTYDPVRQARLEARKAAAALLRTVVARSGESEGHCERVATWSRRLARELGLSSDRVLDVELGALLHDIGHVGGVDSTREDPLTDEDWAELRRHCELGAALLQEIPSLRRAAPLILSHHEEYNGTGYPFAKRGIEIPIDGRIFHLVDAYEALTTDRLYTSRITDEAARVEIAKGIGTRFDPVVHSAFSRIDPVEWRALVANVE